MPLHFEQYPDIHLRNAPLQEVICQVRYPAILRIANEDPVAFQEAIRERYTDIQIEQPVIVGPLGQETPQVELKPRLFRFKDRTDNYSVALALDFFALVSKSYNSWNEFSDNLEFVFQRFQSVYHIQYALRIGLRYTNVLTLEKTGTRNLDELISLVRDEIVMLFRISEIENPYSVRQEIRTEVDKDGDFTLMCGLKEKGSTDFILDFDRYIEGEIEVDNLLDRCERYHHTIYNAFRWAIADDKLDVFDPLE
jgi:uncharacterized protein (TIGR04255 family)